MPGGGGEVESLTAFDDIRSFNFYYLKLMSTQLRLV